MDYDAILAQFKKKILKFVSICLFPALKTYTYFIIVGDVCLVQDQFESDLILAAFLVFHLLFIYILVFYLRLLPKEEFSTRNIFYPEPTQSDKQYKNINPYLSERINFRGKYRKKICKICLVFKPPRSHHCSDCDTCILKMDHHCFFINTCIGFSNYKFFVLFLFFNAVLDILCIVIVAIQIFEVQDVVFGSYVVALALFFIELLICFPLFLFHCLLISRNETTIESIYINQYIDGVRPLHRDIFQEGPLSAVDKTIENDSGFDKKDRTILNPYNLGATQNFYEVFGSNLLLCFQPTFTSRGNGIVFKKNTKEIEEEYE